MSSTYRKNVELSEKKKLLLKQLLQKETAAQLSQQRGSVSETRPAVLPRANRDAYPLALSQQHSWKFAQFAPGKTLVSALRLTGLIDLATFEQCLHALIARHEILRAVFLNQDGTPIQHILPSVPVALPYTDLSTLPPEVTAQSVEQFLDACAEETFDLVHGPLFRTSLVRLTNLEHLFIFTFHPLLADNATLTLLAHDLVTLYRQETTGEPSSLPELSLTYADYAQWQHEYFQGATLQEQLHYWKQHLAGATLTLNLPLDHPCAALASTRQVEATHRLSASLTQQVHAFCERESLPLEHCLFATLALLLNQYTGQTDIVIGRSGVLRAPELATVAGPFATTLPVRVQCAEELTGQAFLQQIHTTLLAADRSQGLPLEQIVESVYPHHDLTRQPLFQTSFAFYQLPSFVGLAASMLPLRLEQAFQDLSFVFQQSDPQLALSVFYDSDLFDAASIERLHGHYTQLLTFLVAFPFQSLAAFSCLTPSERTRIVSTWNAATLDEAPPASLCMHHLFEQQVERTPNAIALSDGQQRLTYSELNNRVNQLAHLLRKRGIGPEQFVGLCLSRSFDLLIGQLAILKAGAAYVPLDPAYPRDRLDFTIQDAQLTLILTQQDLLERMPFSSELALCLDTPDLFSQESTLNPVLEMRNEHLAYIIYTSGSTGRPKGVCIQHKNAVVFLYWARQEFSDEELAGVLFGTSMCFDLSIFEVFAPLSWGGRVILATSVLDLPRLAASEQITLLNTVPSAATALLTNGDLPSSLLTINLAGEALARDLIQALYRQTQVRRVCNLYGPTEDTTYSTWATMDAKEQGAVTIGRPLVNTQAYIVDAQMRPVPVGVSGELYLGGDGQARGYLNRPDLTAERFIPDPFSRQPGSRLYKTGDLARYRPDGSIDYLGRLDHQVKVRGFRIELGEIEAHLRQYPTLADVVVVAMEDKPGEKYLVAYVVPHPQRTCDTVLLRQYLQGLVPSYMVPTFFIVLKQLPQTLNGKVDRKALPTPRDAKMQAGQSPAEMPQGKREQWLALLWQDIFHVAQVERADNFFLLGGDSARAMRLLARMQADFQLSLSLEDIFAAPTLAQLAAKLQTVAVQPGLEPIPSAASTETALPLVFAQQHFWFQDQLDKGTARWNVPLVLELSGTLQRLALYQAVRELIDRHEPLRTTIRVVRGNPVQEIADLPAPAFSVLDLETAVNAQEQSPDGHLYASQEVLAEIQRPFDLATGPLLRVRLLRVRADYHVLLLTMHHAIIDTWSLSILAEELSALYTAFSAGHPSPLPALPVRYRDFVAWQREHQAPRFAEDLAYWKEFFSPLPPTLTLPLDYPRPVVQTQAGNTLRFHVTPTLSRQLQLQSQQEGVTLFQTLLTAFLVLLARHSGQDDLVVGTEVANRPHPELETLVGCFVNTLALRADLSGNPTGRELLHRVAALTLDAFSHQAVPFEQVVEAVRPPSDPSRSPLFQVRFLLQNVPATLVALPELRVEPVEFTAPTSQYDLSLIMEEHPDGLRLKIEYNTRLFAAATIEHLQVHYQTLLQALCERPELRIQEIELLTVEGQPLSVSRVDQGKQASESQVKLEVVEQALRNQTGVHEAVVLSREDRPAFSQLVAYVQPELDARLDISLLRLALKKQFPAYLLPTTVTELLETFPCTVDGQIDRVQLQRLEQDSVTEQVVDLSPLDILENTLAQIWQKVLKLPLIERTENFFELGGHSLLVMQVLAAIREELHVAILTRQFFTVPTIARLAALIGSELASDEDHSALALSAIPPLVAVEHTGELPLSFAQQRLWFLDQLEGSSATYNIPVILQLTGELNLPVLQSSVREIVRRHEALRTTFPKERHTPIQCVSPLPLAPVEIVDFSNGELAESQATILQEIQTEVQRPFDIANGPLLRTRVLRLGPEKHIVIFVMHHIISDGWSMAVMAQEFNTLYNAFAAGKPSPLPELALQYGDYVIWQRQYLQGPRLAAHLEYWQKQLTGAATLKLPFADARVPGYSAPGAHLSEQWSQSFAQQLQVFSQQEDVTLFMTLLAGFQVLLAYYSGQDDITLGSPVANRTHPALEPLVGFFVNTLALRTNLVGNPTLREVLQRVRDVTLGAYDHQDIPFEQVVEAVHPERQSGVAPLFQVLFVLQNNAKVEIALADLQVTSLEMHTATAKFDMSIGIDMNARGLGVGMEYNTQLFELTTIQQMQEHYRLLLEYCIAHPESRLTELYEVLSRPMNEESAGTN